jgi:hypothetical protein
MNGSVRRKILFYIGLIFLTIFMILLIFDLTRRGVYDGKMGLNIAVIGDSKVSFLLLRPDEGMVGWVDLPNNTKIMIFNSTASYPVGSVWNYGVSVKSPYSVIEKSLGQAMGVTIARSMKLDREVNVENVLSELLSITLKTDLSFKDRFLIRAFLAESVKSKKIIEYSLPSSVFDIVTEPDGEEFREINSTMALWTKNKFVFEPILDENVDVSVNNVSSIPGLANVLSKQLESAGVRVIEVKGDKTDNIYDHGCVYVVVGKYEFTEKLLSEHLDCKKGTAPNGMTAEDGVKIYINDQL